MSPAPCMGKTLPVLALLLLSCSAMESSSDGGGQVISSSVPESPEPEVEAGTGEDPGSMCSLYETTHARIGLGGGSVEIPIPVLCDPYAPYTGYPPDTESPAPESFDYLRDQNPAL